MTYLIRIILIGLIIYLIARMINRYFAISKDSGDESGQDKKNTSGKKKISKDTGEYIDYEELDN